MQLMVQQAKASTAVKQRQRIKPARRQLETVIRRAVKL
jgi:hypothetical protein